MGRYVAGAWLLGRHDRWQNVSCSAPPDRLHRRARSSARHKAFRIPSLRKEQPMKRLAIVLFFFIESTVCSAQWQPDSNLGDYSVATFGTVDTNFFVSLENVTFPF